MSIIRSSASASMQTDPRPVEDPYGIEEDRALAMLIGDFAGPDLGAPPVRVADLGCGDGPPAVVWRTLFAAEDVEDLEYQGFDGSAAHIERAALRYAEEVERGRARFRAAAALEALPRLETEGFPLVFLGERALSRCNGPERRRAFAELSRIVSGHAVLSVTTPQGGGFPLAALRHELHDAGLEPRAVQGFGIKPPGSPVRERFLAIERALARARARGEDTFTAETRLRRAARAAVHRDLAAGARFPERGSTMTLILDHT